MINVTIYNEFCHERENEGIKKIYPEGIHGAIAGFLEKNDDISVRCFTLDTVNDITDEVLSDTDVIMWWGHMRHGDVPDEVAERVKNHVLKGMGAIFLHSGHHSKPFRLLMGTTCNLTWRESSDKERLWVINSAHPITQGLGRYFELPAVETYGEPFGIPNPDEVLLIGWYSGGEVFRSGCTFHRESGKIFYFQPGHESFPIFYDENVQLVLTNAVRWAAPVCKRQELNCPWVHKPGEEENESEKAPL